MKIRKLAERNLTGEKWVLYELELAYGATKLILRWSS